MGAVQTEGLMRYREAAALLPGLIDSVVNANMTPIGHGVMIVMQRGPALMYVPGIRPAGKVLGCYAFVVYDKGGDKWGWPRTEMRAADE
jgi:hypothetical protein